MMFGRGDLHGEEEGREQWLREEVTAWWCRLLWRGVGLGY